MFGHPNMGDSDSRPQAAAAGHAAEGKRAAQRYARRAADERRAQRIFRRAVRDAREEGAHYFVFADSGLRRMRRVDAI